MARSQQDKDGLVARLKAARTELTRTSQPFGICGALYRTELRLGLPARCPYSLWLQHYIKRQLAPHNFLEEWLSAKQPRVKQTLADMKAYRLQWIDWMIDSIEKS